MRWDLPIKALVSRFAKSDALILVERIAGAGALLRADGSEYCVLVSDLNEMYEASLYFGSEPKDSTAIVELDFETIEEAIKQAEVWLRDYAT